MLLFCHWIADADEMIVFECGPLTMAVIANDLIQVQRLLKRDERLCEERNLLGQTPLHFAAGRPQCLKVLLGVMGKNAVDSRDCCGLSALDSAMVFSTELCTEGDSGRGSRCSRCSCADCVILLIRANCRILVNWKSNLAFRLGTNRCKGRYARHLRHQRERLRDFALDNLPAPVTENFNLRHEHVLDFGARQVLHLLQKCDIDIASFLGENANISHDYQPIYSFNWDPDDADRFFRQGFRDVDPQEPEDFPIWWWGPGHHMSMPYLQWLVQHGVDPSRRLHRRNNIIYNAHCIFQQIGNSLRRAIISASDKRAVHELNAAVLDVDIERTDNCQCACSVSGCSPFVTMLKEMFHRAKTIDMLIERFCRYLEHFEGDLNMANHAAAIRFLTFESLDMVHICCDGKWDLHDPDEVEQEDESMNQLLEELLLEFEARFLTIPEGTSSIDFWQSYWKTRMNEVLEELNERAMSAGEKQRAEELGVIWHSEPPEEVNPNANPFGRQTWDYYIYELDQI